MAASWACNYQRICTYAWCLSLTIVELWQVDADEVRSGENVNMVVQLEREDDAEEPGPVIAPFFPKVRYCLRSEMVQDGINLLTTDAKMWLSKASKDVASTKLSFFFSRAAVRPCVLKNEVRWPPV